MNKRTPLAFSVMLYSSTIFSILLFSPVLYNGEDISAIYTWATYSIIMHYLIGLVMGAGYVVFKYSDYELNSHYYKSEFELKELYDHDHTAEMVIRNILFYCGLSWYGVYSFCVDED